MEPVSTSGFAVFFKFLVIIYLNILTITSTTYSVNISKTYERLV